MLSFTHGDRLERITGLYSYSQTNWDMQTGPEYIYLGWGEQRLLELRLLNISRLTQKYDSREEKKLEQALQHSAVSSYYIPLYRIHKKKHFQAGVDYPLNWVERKEKQEASQRYSPPGTSGYYFGLTLDAAEDEILHYSKLEGKSEIDSEEYMILVIEACLDNILYLPTPAINAVWEAIGLEPPQSLIELYLSLIHSETNNSITNKIGVWARKQGYDGIIYPSARYGQEERIMKKVAQGYKLIPVVNFIDIGSHLEDGVTPHSQMAIALMKEISRLGQDNCVPIFAEPNLVLFSGVQVSGRYRGVMYQTFPMAQRNQALAQDDRMRQFKNYFYWTSKEKPKWMLEED